MSDQDYNEGEIEKTEFDNRINTISNLNVSIQTALNRDNFYHRFSGLEIDSTTTEMSSQNTNIVQNSEIQIDMNQNIKSKNYKIILEYIENLMGFIVFVWCFILFTFLLIYLLFFHDENWRFRMINLCAYIAVWILLILYELYHKKKDYTKFRMAFFLFLIILIILLEFISYFFKVGSVWVMVSCFS